MGSRMGFYTLLAIVGLLGAMGFGVMAPSGSNSSLWQITASAAPLADNDGDNSGNSDSDNDGSDNSDSDNGDDNNDNSDNGGEVIVVVVPTPVPPPAPAPAAQPAPPPPPPPPPPPVAQGPCQFVLGFLFLHQQLQGIDGNCLSNEQPNPQNGDSLQQTERGLMVYQKSTNTMRWTDGFRTFTYSACGLQQRLNTQTFVWETNPAIAAQVVAAPGTCNVV